MTKIFSATVLVVLWAVAARPAVDAGHGGIGSIVRDHIEMLIGRTVAHQTGEITKIQHDAAIVYTKRPFVLVVLVRGQPDPKAGSTLIADITRALYDASQS